MTDPGPISESIERAAPSDVSILGSCPLQYAFRKSRVGPHAPSLGSPAAELGSISHRVLESVVADRSLLGPESQSALDAAWDRELDRYRERQSAAGNTSPFGPPESWTSYYLVQARLSVAAERLKEVLEGCGNDAEFLTETPITDPDTVLWGIPDLIVRSPNLHGLVDYKTGGVFEPDSRELRDSYRTQMHIYAYLEFKESGMWPEKWLLLSLQDGLVELEADHKSAKDSVGAALKAVAAYNQGTPSTPSATPSGRTCRYCSFVARCGPFWDEVEEIAAEGFAAARGTVTRVSSTPLGGYAVDIRVPHGSHLGEKLTIRRIEPEAHPLAEQIKVGDRVCMTHLYATGGQEDNHSEWRLRTYGTLSLLESG